MASGLTSEILRRKRSRSVALLKRMISIPSSNPHVSDYDETELAKYLKEELEDAAIEVELRQVTSEYYARDSAKRKKHTRPNVIARIGNGGGMRLILNGHLDTVSGETMKRAFVPRLVGDRLYGRGSADMKGGLAAIVAAAEAILESNTRLKGQLVLSFVVDEETLGQGTKDYLKKDTTADFAIVAEPTENTLGIAQAGYMYFLIHSKGESKHGQVADPHLMPSAFVRATNTCNKMLEDKRIIRSKTVSGLRMSSTFNFSPTKYTPPPSYAWMTMDEFTLDCLLGLIPDRTVTKSEHEARTALNEIRRLVADARKDGRTNQLEMSSWNVGFIQRENAHTMALEKAMKNVLGHHQHSYVQSFCDATHFYRAGIPTVLFGPGRMDLAHSTSEYVNVSEVKDATSVLAHAIENILGSRVR